MNSFITFHCASVRSIHPIYTPTFCVQVLFMRWLLVGMMKVGFLKRLESSVHSFEITMERTIGKIESLEKKIRNFIANPDQNPELDELELDLNELDEEELEASRLVGGKFKYRLEDLELDSG